MYKSAEVSGGVYDPSDAATGAYSYWNTVNPFAMLTKGNIRVPKTLSRMLGTSDKANRTSVVLSNIIGSSLLAAGLVGAARAGQWFRDRGEFGGDNNVAKGMDRQLGTTFKTMDYDEDDDEKKRRKGHRKSAGLHKSAEGKMKMGDALLPVIPITASVLAAAASYRAADNLFDSIRNKEIDRSIRRKSKEVEDLIRLRAKLSKGTITPGKALASLDGVPEDSDDPYIKEASEDRQKGGFFYNLGSRTQKFWDDSVPGEGALAKSTAAAAVIVAALFGTSAVASYKYYQADNENNMQHKAFKKGLREYARQKAGMTPITMLTPNQNVFNDIDGDTQPAARDRELPRDLPEVKPDDINRPVTLTL